MSFLLQKIITALDSSLPIMTSWRHTRPMFHYGRQLVNVFFSKTKPIKQKYIPTGGLNLDRLCRVFNVIVRLIYQHRNLSQTQMCFAHLAMADLLYMYHTLGAIRNHHDERRRVILVPKNNTPTCNNEYQIGSVIEVKMFTLI